MKLILFLLPLVACGFFLVGCGGDAGREPAPQGSSADRAHVLAINKVAPEPTAEMARRAGQPLEHIGMGYWVFQRKCLECHEARVPEDPTDKNFHPLMKGMVWNAGLTTQEVDGVLSYLQAAGR